LPYFAVQFDYKGEKGYGHIIEGVDDAPNRDDDGYEEHGELGEKGGGEFPRFVFRLSIFPGVLLTILLHEKILCDRDHRQLARARAKAVEKTASSRLSSK
jgi:hypothetical protein